MNIHERTFFLCFIFPPLCCHYFTFTAPFFFSVDVRNWSICIKNYEQRAKEQVQLNAVHRGMRVTEFFPRLPACEFVFVYLFFLLLVYTFWCGHTFSTVAYSSSLRLLLLVIVLHRIFVHFFEYIAFRTELVFCSPVMFSFSVRRVLNCENVANMWSHGLVDIRICHTKLSRQNNIYPPIKSSLFAI